MEDRPTTLGDWVFRLLLALFIGGILVTVGLQYGTGYAIAGGVLGFSVALFAPSALEGLQNLNV